VAPGRDSRRSAGGNPIIPKSDLPKFALFIADLGGGGAERVFVNLAKALWQRGYAVDLVVGTLDGAAYLDELPCGVRLVNLQVNRMAFGGPSLIRYLRRERPSAILATRVHSSCLAVLARQFSGVRTRVIVRESNMVGPGLQAMMPVRRLAFSLAIRYCYPRADHVIAVSRGVAAELNGQFGVLWGKLSVVYSPIISDALQNRASEPLDHEWFREGQPPVILSVGRLTAQKDQQTLIRAFALVRKNVVARLLILGEGENRAELEALVSELGLALDVSLLGFRENPFAFMARARLFVLPSAWEGLPGALIQALACGCPVVSTDCPSGPREILQDGRLGRLVPVGDPTNMAKAILESLSNGRKAPCGPEDLRPYTVEHSTREYLRILLGEEAGLNGVMP
jgi:glycosyltransferase involved in cell wall biosynthesis